MALRTFTTAGVNNLWSNAANWDTAPGDTDTFTLSAGQTCEFDADLSAWAGLGASTIPAGTTLIATTTAGAYVLKMNGDLTVNGTLQAGTSVAVPYPSTCTFTIGFSSASNSIVINDTTGRVYFYCDEPTNKYVTLTAQAVAATPCTMSIDTDITSDWANGSIIAICDLIAPGGSVRDNEDDTITSSTANSITIPSLAATKEIGAVVVLISRNIRLINSTDYVIKNGKSCHIAAEIYNCTGGGISGTDDSTIGGSYLMPSGEADDFVFSANNVIVDAGFAQTGTTGTSYGLRTLTASVVNSGSICAGFSYGSYTCVGTSFNGIMVACSTAGYSDATSCAINGDIIGCQNGVRDSKDVFISGDIANVTTAIINSIVVVSNCELGKQVGGVTSTRCLQNIPAAKFFNVVFSATTEFLNYNNTLVMGKTAYIESADHDGITNAYEVWCLGGIVTSQTASPPTGYTIFYDHEVESAVYPCFRQYAATVQPGTAIEVSAVIRNTDGIDVSSVGPPDLRPRLEIIDVFADPLVDSTQTALDSDPIAVSDGSDTDWQDVDVIWANTGDSPRQVYVRIICYSHDASTHTIDEAWSVATYQDQITALYNSSIPIRTEVSVANSTTSFTLTAGQATINAYRYNTITIQDADDGHWEQRKILAWTAARVVTVDHAFTFIPAVGDLAYILSAGYGETDLIVAGTVPDNLSTANSINLGANASATNDIYNENLITLTGGTGSGQARLIADYFGALKAAAVRDPWIIIPDNTTTYRISPFSGILLANTGVCAGGAVDSITLRTPAPDVANIYFGHTIFISGGTGKGQARLITAYSAGRVATISPNWDVTPLVNDSVYIVLPIGIGNVYANVTAILADTNEIQGKLPDDYIMGSSVTTSMDDEINNINANAGKVVYGSVTGTGGVPKPIQTGSVTGFVEDEKL